MTTTYDPRDPSYVDEKETRDEMTRVFDVCHGCRRCVDFCPSFPTLFEMIDELDDRSAGWLTPAQQDRVVDGCFHCTRCALTCPYAVDVPQLMLRANAMRSAQGHLPVRHRRATRTLGRRGLALRITGARPGSTLRRLGAAVTGVSPVRLLPPVARERFSTWFRKRPGDRPERPQGAVTVFPTCLVEYHAVDIGKDLVRVYERNRIDCSITSAGCCGAPLLHAGDIARFAKVAEKNTRALAVEIRAGTDVVVPQPTCGHVVKSAYRAHVGEASAADAELVADRTFDAVEYLMKLHDAEDTVLDTEFEGEAPRRITYHTPCHLRAQDIGSPSRELLELTGADVTPVQQCAGIGGGWGLRAGNEAAAIPIAEALGAEIERADGDAVAGDCHLANTAILEQAGIRPSHPLQVVARAYGISQA